ncbi:LysR family transcriptional regulator [Aliivibrio sp. S4TY2]|uniref:LysR family transcriptional regulator n=1 Tax=unclassified Aliivibrio TaxID=2645654 RepID=UPI00237800CE|nr:MULTISPECIES: LysR family transcriptional regulator [unclassified Aliivibrio]MDD9155238.1 LysR family transcriptional regulator [Aliivibrio sp. S4TY2]MDD9159210.1 LysR family transcriptional regulator [Aliivibrio sp. S4TY1]MDD9163240.1 LysR family transcriptional regulator [Aliivibrio sp. S4MY2]MDD9167209.1 LysR family transcriptional regulator [Aliivibrio sp. S4MY4]MDD9184317.1 LysR family transcriptional regulator [Aliivibrio sp. S4MY3]
MDQLSAMRAFVRVVETGSFSATGKEMNTSQTTISKKVAALEKQIGVKLLTRSSRDHSLTSAGSDYYDTCVNILSELDEAEAKVRTKTTQPQGIIRVAAPVAFGRFLLAPIVAEFFQQYPDIKIDLLLNDKHVNLISEGIDVAIRVKKLEDSSLVARHLFDNPMYLFASPDYLEQHGEPEHPNDLATHNCLIYSGLQEAHIWNFNHGDKEYSVPVKGNFQSDNGDVLLDVALTGVGIVSLPIWMAKAHLTSGHLRQIITTYSGQNLPINAIYPQRRYTPLKVRCFVDFLKQKLSLQ